MGYGSGRPILGKLADSQPVTPTARRRPERTPDAPSRVNLLSPPRGALLVGAPAPRALGQEESSGAVLGVHLERAAGQPPGLGGIAGERREQGMTQQSRGLAKGLLAPSEVRTAGSVGVLLRPDEQLQVPRPGFQELKEGRRR